MVILHFIGVTYLLFLGFLMYAAVAQSWTRLKIGIKILLAPALLFFGAIDVAYNILVGSILFWEFPPCWTFSQRCSIHLYDKGIRGKIAGAFSVPLNAVLKDHIR